MLKIVKKILQIIIFLVVSGSKSNSYAMQLIEIPFFLNEEIQHLIINKSRIEFQKEKENSKEECGYKCEEIKIIHKMLSEITKSQKIHEYLNMEILVVKKEDVDAHSYPSGEVVISENFVQKMQLTQAELAFVIAHEIAHSILGHEIELIEYASIFAGTSTGWKPPYSIVQSELTQNYSLFLKVSDILKEAEYEADTTGMMIASMAKINPIESIEFLNKLCTRKKTVTILQTHPSECSRATKMKEFMPLAIGIYERAVNLSKK